MTDPVTEDHVEIHLDARQPRDNRVVLNGEDLTQGLASFTLHANAHDKLPVLHLEPLVVTGTVAAGVSAPVLHLPDAARAALVALGWTPPAAPDADPGLPLSAVFDNQPTERPRLDPVAALPLIDVVAEALDSSISEFVTQRDEGAFDANPLEAARIAVEAIRSSGWLVTWSRGAVEIEWCVFHGGEAPDECAGYRVVEDQAAAEEDVQWMREAGTACRLVTRGPWEVRQHTELGEVAEDA